MKLTKSALRSSQQRLAQLERYLPTIQLKKGLLQQEVFKAQGEVLEKEAAYESLRKELEALRPLFAKTPGVDFAQEIRIASVERDVENIAGIDLPVFQRMTFEPSKYSLLATPLWTDGLVNLLQKARRSRLELNFAHERESILVRELREVTIRVNLFEKIMIPRTRQEIKRVRLFLSDQELMAVARAKAAQKRVQMS